MAGNSASSYSEMDGIQKAAILLITLGPEKAAVVFKHLKEDEIEQLTLEIANTRSVTPAQKEQVYVLPSSTLPRVVLDMQKTCCRKLLVRAKHRKFLAS